MTILYDLCARIVELRNKFGITQAELARRLGISRSAVNTWEMGLAIPQLKHVIEMSKIFNTTVDGMLNISDQVVINITDLSKKEQQVIFSMIDCLKNNHEK
ncbi:MAG: helix-turn-helix transcriptional regulator [Oscillospiraceae bacterium]|nr:helix-turn-helix transcriptional regulator [Oscillospiraceae bacterium]